MQHSADDTTPADHKTGFVSLVGRPNAGKSTLLNALMGQKLSIVTPKPQTTRHRILGILNEPDTQIIFVDTPGIIQPKYGLHRAMMESVGKAVKDSEVVLWVLPMDEKWSGTTDELQADPVLKQVRKAKQPVVVALNKADTSDQAAITQRIAEVQALLPGVKAVVPISALHQFNLEALLHALRVELPPGPPFYDKDQITDRPERFFVSEIIREKIFQYYDQEIPYSTEVTILLFEERPDLTYIDAEIHVERETQKGILIGKGGAALKKIGTWARKDIEAFLDRKVFLNLYVRVAENWKENPRYLKNFGYDK